MTKPWIQLTSGASYEYATGRIEGPFDLHDVAHPLSLIARYAGHTSEPWSVAAHSVVVARAAATMIGPLAAFAALMHDAHECILGDIPTPFAHVIGYGEVLQHKETAQAAVEERLGVPSELRERQWPAAVAAAVKEFDLACLWVERDALMVPSTRLWGVRQPEADVEAAVMEEFGRAMMVGEAFGPRAAWAFRRTYHRLLPAALEQAVAS